MKERIENIQPFQTGKKGVVHISTSTDTKGYMELQAIEGGSVFLFKGALSAAECEAALKGANVNFHLAAAVGQSACLKMEPSIGELTVFSPLETTGFLKMVEFVG